MKQPTLTRDPETPALYIAMLASIPVLPDKAMLRALLKPHAA